MNTLRPYGPLDEPGLPAGDAFFTGVNERLAPLQLAPGVVSRGTNKRFRNGKCEDRLGCPIMPWMKGAGRTPWDEIYGGAVFSDPNQAAEWDLVAADGGVWKFRPGIAATPVPLPAGLTLTAATFAMFVQCFDVMLLLRGPDADPLVCTNLDEGFKAIVITPEQAAQSLRPIPRSRYGLCFSNRLFLIEGKDLLAVSDLLTYTAYLPATNTFRINSGSVDSLVSVHPFGPSQLICLKDQSVSILDNVFGDLSQVAQREVTRRYGCGARLSPAASGTNLYWVSGEGRVRSLTLTQLNQTQDTDEALSDDLEVSLSRINGTYLSGMVSEIWNSRLYVAAPLDDATATVLLAPNETNYGPGVGTVSFFGLVIGNRYRWTPGPNEVSFGNGADDYFGPVEFTAIEVEGTAFGIDASPTTLFTGRLEALVPGLNNNVLVYDFLTQAWAGVDAGEGIFNVKQFLKAKLDGRERLFFLTGDGLIRLYEEGYEDDRLLPVETPYMDILVNTLPAPGNSIHLPGGGVITATSDSFNTSNTWGCSDLATARANLLAGYQNDWSVAAAISEIDWGIRLTSTGTVLSSVIVGNWSFVDLHVGDEITSTPIVSSVTARGYLAQNPDHKRFLVLMPILQTWAPEYTLSAIPNGVGMEVAYQSAVTRSRTTYEVQGEEAWDESNVNDDHETPKRQDYSIVLPDLGLNLGAAGVSVDLLQFSTDRVPVSELGIFCQLKVANTQGRIELWGVLVEAQEHEHQSGAVV